MSRERLSKSGLLLSCLVGLALAACGGSGDGGDRTGNGEAGGGAHHDAGPDSGSTHGPLDGGTGDGAVTPSGPLVIEPVDPIVNLTNGKAQTIEFSATLDGAPAHPVWSLSRAELGSIDSKTGIFKTGSVGGEAIVTANVGSIQASTKVTVIVLTEQNGAKAGTSTCAAGGCGGVGGEGAGEAVTSDQKKALDAKSPTADTAFGWLYPYDATVWPLGLLAPLMQWSFGATPADAIKIELKSPFYRYTGYFARPSALAAGDAFVRHPIPQAVWDAATRSSAPGPLNVKLTALAAGKAVGPIAQTWTIANGALKGTVYYQSYGTKLAKNFSGAQGGDGKFGGATLAISGGSTEPALVAGADGDATKCRVCHTVSADGSRMIVQHGDDYSASSSYDLTKANFPETPYTQLGVMGWAALYPDGSVALGNDGPLSGGANTVNSSLLNAATGDSIASPALTDFVTKAAMPMFSPDGSKVAFVFYAGAGNASIGAGDPTKLVVMDFDRKTKTFSNPALVYQSANGDLPGWPAFMPSGKQLVFQMDLASGTGNEYFVTRNGARGALWYVDLETKKAHPLELANGTKAGTAYLPVGPNNHTTDAELAYEPTINPIASGGYAWVVFTSRRMYGNVATIDPTWSDPRDHDLTSTPTPKKLWVAAIDLPPDGEVQSNAKIDPSHPAFYLPAQELLAGNSRGYWVPEPCRADGKSCESGDQCCAGYCAHDATKDANVCGGKPPSCAAEFDRCEDASDCCAGANGTVLSCINGRCAAPVPE